MYRFSAVAALLLAAAPLCAADPNPTEDNTPWYDRAFSNSKPKVEPKPAQPAEKSITRQDVARSLEQEQKQYMDRLQFCTKLRQIATESGDDELLRKADDLEQQATDVYMKKTSKLEAIVIDVKAAEANLEQKRREPPAGSASASRVVTSRAPNGRPIVAPE